jgi:hypothetical protein
MIPFKTRFLERMKAQPIMEPLSDTCISSEGLIERKMNRNYGSFEVYDFLFGTDLLTPVVTIYPFTWSY